MEIIHMDKQDGQDAWVRGVQSSIQRSPSHLSVRFIYLGLFLCCGGCTTDSYADPRMGTCVCGASGRVLWRRAGAMSLRGDNGVAQVYYPPLISRT